MGLGTVSAEQAARLGADLKASGGPDVDLTGYRRNLDNYAARHILNRHGDAARETARGNAPLSPGDFERLPQVLANPDASIYAGKNQAGQDVILSAKRENGHFIVAEEIREKARVLSVASLYKKVAPPPAIDAATGAAPLSTPEALRSTAQMILRQIVASRNFLHGGDPAKDTPTPPEPAQPPARIEVPRQPGDDDKLAAARRWLADQRAAGRNPSRGDVTRANRISLERAQQVLDDHNAAEEAATNNPPAPQMARRADPAASDDGSLAAAPPEAVEKDDPLDLDDETPAATPEAKVKQGNLLQRARAEIARHTANAKRTDALSAASDATDTRANVAGRHARTAMRLDFDRGQGKDNEREALLDRQAATAVLEAGSHRSQLIDDLQQIKAGPDKKLAARYAPAYQRALDLLSTPDSAREFQAKIDGYRRMDTEQASAREKAGLPVDKKGRMTRVHDDPLSPEATIDHGRGFRSVEGHTRIADALAAGKDPGSMDLADLAGREVQRSQRAINQKAYHGKLAGMKAADGKPLLASVQEVSTALNPDGSLSSTVRVPRGYQAVQAGDNVLVAHQDVAPLLRAQYGDSAVRNHWLGERALDYAALAKHGAIGIDTFHGAQVAIRGLLGFGTHGISEGLTGLEVADRDLDRAVAAGHISQADADTTRENRRVDEGLLAHGLNVGKATDNLLEAARQANLVEKIPVVGHAAKATADFIFHSLQPAYMMQAARVAYARNKARFAELSDEEVLRRSAREVNEFYGNLGTQGLLKSKTMQDAARLLFFAPSFTEGRFRTEARGIGRAARTFADGVRGKGWRVGSVAQAMGGILLASVIGSQMVNLFSRGKPTWENEEAGHRWDAWVPGGKHGFFFSPLSLCAEFSHALSKYIEGGQSPLDALLHVGQNKLSGLSRAALDLATGHDSQGRPFASMGERVKAAALDAAPLPMQLGSVMAKDPKSAFGLKANAEPGSVEKQLAAAAGIRLDNAPSARAQMRQIAERLQPKGEAGAHPASVYADLRHALENEDLAGAQAEIKRLVLEGGKTLAQVASGAGRGKDGKAKVQLFTGSAQGDSHLLDHLTPAEVKTYVQAQKERAADVEFYNRAIKDLLQNGAAVRELATASSKNERARKAKTITP